MYQLFETTGRLYTRVGSVRGRIPVNLLVTSTELMDTLCDKTFIALKTGELVTEVTKKEVFDYTTTGLGAFGGQALRGTVGQWLRLFKPPTV